MKDISQELIAFFKKEQRMLARLSTVLNSTILSQQSIISGKIIESLEKNNTEYAALQLNSLEGNIAEELRRENLSDDERLKLENRLKKIKKMIALLLLNEATGS